MTEGVKRQYRSAVREAAAAETADRIRAAAAELFVRQGYAATTLKEIAQRAGVGERTLYDRYGDKRRVLSRTISHLAMGEVDRTPLADRPEFVEARELDDPWEGVARTMAYEAALAERAAELILVAEEAGRVDRALKEQARKGSEMGYAVFARLAERLEERGALRDGMDATTGADIAFALGSPQMFDILRRRRGWSAERYRDWLVATVQQQVLRPERPDPQAGPEWSSAEGKTSR